MNTAVNKMSVQYGKLGLSTNPELIEARAAGLKAAADAFHYEHLSEILSCAFGMSSSDEPFPLADKFREKDPTFDVRMRDREASLLACAQISYEIQSATQFGKQLALIAVTTSFGGLRKFVGDPDLEKLADEHLAQYQSAAVRGPSQFSSTKPPKALTDAMAAVPESGQVDVSIIRQVLVEIQKSLDGKAQASVTADNALRVHIIELEEELRTHYWVVNGWATTFNKPFRDLPTFAASIVAGRELASKTSNEIGIYSAPAMLDNILASGRADFDKELTLSAAAKALSLDQRKTDFSATAESSAAPWLPLSTAMGLAALANDESDWEPRFKRSTNIGAKSKLKPSDLGIQSYREALVYKLLSEGND